ncbi:DUF72 domain-containing protein [Aliiglaciecola litoralis]|uniref:DUF72 domain-containing protein n=1 Tax=Aliiglaciecola litoralis TaxID=582857 RepID=A0ABP3WP38_9ALTE
MQFPHLPLKFGCPMWSHPKWFGTLVPSTTPKASGLNAYARFFNSVEGNTSFYQLPNESSVQNWREQVPADFSFTFKFPREISHAADINSQVELLRSSYQRFGMFEEQLGCLMLQLPPGFSARRAKELEHFVGQLPKEFHYAIEMRHLDWFDKGQNERWLNRLLESHGVNRVILDTRGLFACKTPQDTLVMEVQTKKPKLPTHAVATSNRPIVRFVGHPTLAKNREFLAPWVDKIAQWLAQDLQPYVFFHMPDNAQAPWLAALFFEELKIAHPELLTSGLDIPVIGNQQLSIF